jgi:spectinomycin phosphotransferase
VKVPPADLSDVEVLAGCEAWGLAIADLEHFPHGFGSHHWLARTDDGRKFFVTVDDLDTKPWLGGDRKSVFAMLVCCYGTARAVGDHGLSFVVAPLLSTTGEVVVRLSDRYTLAIFPFVDGEPGGEWGEPSGRADVADLVHALADLHGTSLATCPNAPQEDLDIAGRSALEGLLDTPGTAWEDGPFSHAAWITVSESRDLLRRSFARIDEMEVTLRAQRGHRAVSVLTHGEPHPGNIIVATDGRLHFVDWDTVAVASPERDLWMLAGESGESSDWLALYTSLTGVELSMTAIAFYRVAWVLKDVTAFVDVLRAPHADDLDMNKTLNALQFSVEQLARGGGAQVPWVEGRPTLA